MQKTGRISIKLKICFILSVSACLGLETTSTTDSSLLRGESEDNGAQSVYDPSLLGSLNETSDMQPDANNSSYDNFIEDTLLLDQVSRNLSIVVVGRSGSGVSSTIRELIGSQTTCEKPSNASSKALVQFTIGNIPVDNGVFSLRLIDVPGWVDGRTPDEDVQILASLKAYVETFGAPDFYLSLTRFDDSRIDGIHSLFVQSLKRLELFHEAYLNNTDFTNDQSVGNILFVLTRLMSETKSLQRKPEKKTETFLRVIENFAKFRYPLKVAVAENKAVSEYEVPVENGYAKLPNKEFYPRNIWEGLKSLTNDEQLTKMLESIILSREVEFSCNVDVVNTKNAEDDATAFGYLLAIENRTVEDTEVNRKIDEVYESKDRETKEKDVVQKIALQLHLQKENFTRIESLPSTNEEKARFFQNSNLFSALTPAYYLNRAFNLTMPEYILSLTVGKGYDVTTDDITTSLPFETGISSPNSIGYQLPNFMRCRKFLSPDIQTFKSYSENVTDYIEERLKYLNFLGKENVNVSSFKVTVKEGFNLKPEADSGVVTLSAVQEYRTISCRLVEPAQWVLTKEFVDEVYALVSFNKHDRDSVTEWQSFFSKWGTHVVTWSFGGGSVVGNLVGSSVRNAVESEATVDDTLNSIVRFSPFSIENLGVPKYRLIGGDGDTQSENMYTMEEKQRKDLLSRWEKSLNSNFIMLMNEFGMIAISDVVREKIGYERASIIESALDVLLKGELTFTRRRSSAGGRPSTGKLPTGTVTPSPGNGGTARPSAKPAIPTQAPSKPGSESTGNTGTNLQLSSSGDGQGDITQVIFQSHQEQMNLQIRNLERELADRQDKSDAEYAAAVRELERLKNERQMRSQQRHNEMKTSLQQASQNNREYYDRQNRQLEEELRQAAEEEQRQREVFRKQQEADDEQFRLMMEAMDKQWKREEVEYQSRNKCSGWSWFGCATKTVLSPLEPLVRNSRRSIS